MVVVLNYNMWAIVVLGGGAPFSSLRRRRDRVSHRRLQTAKKLGVARRIIMVFQFLFSLEAKCANNGKMLEPSTLSTS